MERTIHFELATIRRVAKELAERGPSREVGTDADAILKGPLPRLFNDLLRSGSRESSEIVYELIRLCIRISRHCRQVDQETPDEPFDANWFAGRLEIASLQLADLFDAEEAA